MGIKNSQPALHFVVGKTGKIYDDEGYFHPTIIHPTNHQTNRP
jgi:hypothetical protein